MVQIVENSEESVGHLSHFINLDLFKDKSPFGGGSSNYPTTLVMFFPVTSALGWILMFIF